MQITFDPLNPRDIEGIKRMFGKYERAEASKPFDVVLNVQTAHAEAHIRELIETIGERLAGSGTKTARLSDPDEDIFGGKPSGPSYWLCQQDGTVVETRRPEPLGVGFAPMTARERSDYLADGTLPEHLTAYLEEFRDFPPAEEIFKPDGAFAPDASASDMPALGGDDEDQVGENDHALDSAGLPWDSRIHASTRTKLKADGRWKPKRGVDAATVATVEAELRALMAIPAPAAAPVPPPPTPAAPLPPAGTRYWYIPQSGTFAKTENGEAYRLAQHEQEAFEVARADYDAGTCHPTPAAPLPPAGAVAVPPPPPAAAAVAGVPQTFAQFMQWLGPKLTAGTLARETVLEAAKAEGLPSVEKLVSRPDLIPLVYARLQP